MYTDSFIVINSVKTIFCYNPIFKQILLDACFSPSGHAAVRYIHPLFMPKGNESKKKKKYANGQMAYEIVTHSDNNLKTNKIKAIPATAAQEAFKFNYCWYFSGQFPTLSHYGRQCVFVSLAAISCCKALIFVAATVTMAKGIILRNMCTVST